MKRTLALLLSFMFVFALLPAGALAADSYSVKVTGVASTVTFTATDGTVNKDVALTNGNGFTAKAGTSVTIVPTIPAGKAFSSWTNDNASGAVISTTSTFTVSSLTSDYSITAVLADLVQINATDATITYDSAVKASGYYAKGQVVTITAVVPEGKKLAGWTIDPAATYTSPATPNATNASFTLTVPDPALTKIVTITAILANAYTVTTKGGATIVGGTAQSNGNYTITVANGAQVTVNAPAPTGSARFKTWENLLGTTTALGATISETFTVTQNEAFQPVYEYPVTFDDNAGGAKVTINTVDQTMPYTGYYKVGDKLNITAEDRSATKGQNFTTWSKTAGTGTLEIDAADKFKAIYTVTADTAGAKLLAAYESYVLQYKENPDEEYSSKIIGDGFDITLAASAGSQGGEFVRWEVSPSSASDFLDITVIPATGTTANKINLKAKTPFKAPTSNVTVYPVYRYSFTWTDAVVTIGGVKQSNTTGKAVVETGTSISITPSIVYNTNGTARTFSRWLSNSHRISDYATNSTVSFKMPAEVVEVSQQFVQYVLTIVNGVDINGVTDEAIKDANATTAPGTKKFGGYGKTLHWTAYAGEFASFTIIDTIDQDKVPAGRTFKDWTANYNLYTTTDAAGNEATGEKGVRVRVEMPAGSGYVVTANYAGRTVDPLAYIQVRQEPARLDYVVGDSFDPTGCEVYYYEPYRDANGNLTNAAGTAKVTKAEFKPGVLVSMSDLVFNIVSLDGGTMIASAPFTAAGQYAVWVRMIVGGVQLAQLLCFNDIQLDCVNVYTSKPSYVKITQPVPTNKNAFRTMFYGEPFSKDGLKVWLYSEGAKGTYMQVAFIDWSDFGFEPANIPTKTALDTAYAASGSKDNAWLKKVVTGTTYDYWINIGHYLSYYTSLDGKKTKLPCLNEITPDGTEVEGVWIALTEGATAFTVTPDPKNNYVAEIEKTGTAFGINAAWTIKSLGTVTKGRQIQVAVTNPTGWSNEQQAKAIAYTNSDSSVAYLQQDATNPTLYYLMPCGSGTTTFTFYRVSEGTGDTLKQVITVTIAADSGVGDPMVSYSLNNDSTDLSTPATPKIGTTKFPLYVGNKMSLYVKTYSPATADTRVTWSISFMDGEAPTDVENYVSLNETSGELVALKYTDRLIVVTATAVNSTPVKLVRYCVIQLQQIQVDGMTLEPAALTMYQYSTYQLTPQVTPVGASDTTMIWTSSLSSVVSVSSDGLLTANNPGTATIKATSNSNPNVSKTVQVTVVKGVLLTSLTLNKTAVSMGAGETVTLSVTYAPTTATTQKVNWLSSDTSIVSVSSNGKLRGIAEGSAVVTAMAADGSGMKAQCVVSVTRLVVTAVTLNKQLVSMYTEEEVQLTETVYPTNASNQVVNWTSSNEKIATVDPDGVITGISAGNCVITATASDGSTKYADCVVVVTKRIPVTGLTLNASSFELLFNDTVQLKATVLPSDATYDKITWTSSNPTNVSVTENGLIGGVTAGGSSVITATAGGKSISITVTVVSKFYSVGTVIRCARRVNVRQNASGTSALVGYAYLGDTYRVLDKSGSWYKIQYNATTTAYIWSYYLSTSDGSSNYTSAGPLNGSTPTPTGSATTAKTLTIVNCTNCVNVRSGAAATYKKLGYAFLNETYVYTAKSTDGAWYTIEFGDQVGYINANFAKVNS